MSYQREFERRLRVGIVGVGSHCYRNILPTMTFLPVKIEALCDIDEQVLRKTAAQYGVSRCYTSTATMYKDVKLDAVFLCVGPFAHPQLTCEALDHGLHVWLEKPPSARAAEVEEMIQHRGDRVAIVGAKKIFMPAMQKARELLLLEEAGALKTMLAEYAVRMPENGTEALESRKMNGWLGNGIHPLSAMLSVGGRVAAVTTHRGKRGGGVCVLEFSDGTIGTLHLAEGMKGPCERYSFFTEHFHVVVENSRRVCLHRGIPFSYTRTNNFAPTGMDSGTLMWEPQNSLATLENKALFTQGFYGEMRYFCDCILDGNKPQLSTLEQAHEIMKVYEAALLSSGERVEIV